VVEAFRRPRSGISQTISIIALILVIALSVATFGLVLRQSSHVQGAQLTVAYQEVQRAKESLRITIYPEHIWLGPPENRFVNMTRIRITSNWAGESVIDYIVAVKTSGERVEGPVDIRVGAFENIENIKPSDLHPQLAKYDNDYNALANEIDYVLFHTKLGNVFEASIGGSPTQKIVEDATSTTITQASSIILTKVLILTMTETKTDWRCPNGWEFIGWGMTSGSQSSKSTSYVIGGPYPLVGAITVHIPAKNPAYSCFRTSKKTCTDYGKSTVCRTTSTSGCGSRVSYWLDAAYFDCCTLRSGHVYWKTISTSCKYTTKTNKFSCRTGTRKCVKWRWTYGKTTYKCCCVYSTLTYRGACVLPAKCKAWLARKGSNYVVISYSLKKPGKFWFKLFWKPYYSIYRCRTVTVRTTGSTTTGECPPPGCQEGATKCIGIDLYKCECTGKWYEPAKRICDFCSWVLIEENAPECISTTSTTDTYTTTITKTEWTSTMITVTVTLAPTTTTITVTPTATTYKCVYATENAKFSICGPTTIRTERIEAEGGTRICTTKITPTPSYAIPTEMTLFRPTPVAIGLILLGMIAYSPRKRRLELLLSILLLIGLILTTAQPLTMPVSASGYTVTETTTVTSTQTYTTTTTVTGSTATVTSTAPTVTKTLTTTIGTILTQTGYYYATCEIHTVKYPVWYCACIIRYGHTDYTSCELQSYKTWIYTSYKGLTSTDVYTITITKGTCPS